nr:phospholipase A I isoform X1 [Tanacetum cinerariifolium]
MGPKTVFEEEECDNMDDNEVISFESSAMITKDTFNSNATVTNMTLTELASSTFTSSDNDRLVVHEGANKTQYSNARQAMAELRIIRLFGNPLEFLPEILPLHQLRHLSLANIRIVGDDYLRSVNVQIETENSSYFVASRHKPSAFFSLIFRFSSCHHPLLASALAKMMQDEGNHVVIGKDENAVRQLISMISSEDQHVVVEACSAITLLASDVSVALQLMKCDIMQDFLGLPQMYLSDVSMFQHSADQFERLLKEICADEDGDLLIDSIPKVFVVSTLVNVALAQPFIFRNYQYPAGTPEIPLMMSENFTTNGPGTATTGAQVGYKRSAYMGSCRHDLWQAIRASSAALYYLDDYSDEPTSPTSDWEDSETDKGTTTGTDKGMLVWDDDEEELSKFVCQLYDSIFTEGAQVNVALQQALASHRTIRYSKVRAILFDPSCYGSGTVAD